jgi:hypothetical protein
LLYAHEWRLTTAARIAVRFFPDLAREMGKGAGAALAIVDEVSPPPAHRESEILPGSGAALERAGLSAGLRDVQEGKQEMKSLT